MANYIEIVRSNYVKVTDPEKFKECIEKYSGTLIQKEGDYYGVLWNEEYQEITFDEETGNELPGNLYSDIHKYLQDGSVLVVMGVGWEKMRYLNGWAIAVDSTGKTTLVTTDQIYEKARKKFKGKEVTAAEY